MGIAQYIRRELCNPEAANHLADQLIRSTGALCNFPYAHPVYIPLRPLQHEYRKLPVQNYLIFYWAKEKKKVVITRVVYGKSDTSALLRQNTNGKA